MRTNAVIYARTSPDCPLSAENQVEHLKAVAAERGWTICNIFVDRPVKLKNGRERRLSEAALIRAIRRGDVQKVLMVGIDRVGRSLADLVVFLEACRIAGVALW